MSASQKCAGCKTTLPKKEYLQCHNCKSKYDIECANVTSKAFSILERKENWKCPECTSKRPKKGNSNTPVRGIVSILDEVAEQAERSGLIPIGPTIIGDPNVTLRTKATRQLSTPERCSQVNDDKEDSNSSYTTLIDELKVYIKDLFHNEMESIREAISKLTNVVTSQNSRIEMLEARVTALESKSEDKQCSGTPPIESIVTQLQAEIAERDQALLSNDIEIVGYPELPNENCIHIALAVAKKLSVDIDEKDIVSAGRVGPMQTPTQSGGEDAAASARTRAVAVRLTRRATRDVILHAARSRRDLNTAGLKLPGPPKTIYVNERLSKYNRILFQKARALARKREYRYIWTRDGKIFTRKEQGKPRHRIRNESDLTRFFG